MDRVKSFFFSRIIFGYVKLFLRPLYIPYSLRMNPCARTKTGPIRDPLKCPCVRAIGGSDKATGHKTVRLPNRHTFLLPLRKENQY
jgi:hypothetical protein